MPASAQDIRSLFVHIFAAMAVLGRRNPDSIEERVCRVLDGKGDSEEIYFSENQTRIITLNPDQERAFIGPEANKLTIAHKLIGPNAGHHVMWDTLLGDSKQFRVLEDRGEQMVNQSTLVWRTHVAGIIHDPGVAYTGQGYWSANHPWNPQKPRPGQVNSNILPNAVLGKASIIAGIQRLCEMRGHNGELMNNDPQPLIVVPNVDMEIRAREVINSSTTPVAVGANAAVAVDNQVRRALGAAEVARFPELQSFSSKRYYFFDLSDPLDRAFYLSKARNATFGFDGLNSSDESRKRRYRVEMWWDAYGGCGPGRPQRAVRGEEP